MTRIINMVFNQLIRTGTSKLEKSGDPLTAEQKAAQKRVRKVMKAARRMHRI